MTPNEARKNLMTGLIYPAVLGSVLYSAIQVVVDPIMSRITHQAVVVFNAVVAFKLIVLFVAIIFFSCDYMYIMFTNELRGWFFVADCVFIVLMYVVWWAIDIKSGAASQPHVGVVSTCLFIFLVVYLLWDLAEHKRATGKERRFYRLVIGWEVGSIIALAGLYLVDRLGYHSPIIFVAIVTIITCFFAALAWKKREHFSS